MARSGKVYIQRRYVGRIYETDEGYEYKYAAEYLEDF